MSKSIITALVSLSGDVVQHLTKHNFQQILLGMASAEPSPISYDHNNPGKLFLLLTTNGRVGK